MAIGLVRPVRQVLASVSILVLSALSGCTLSVAELVPTYGATPLNFLAGTWADAPLCRDAEMTVRFSPPTTTSFSIAIYHEDQLRDRVDCRNEWRRGRYGSRLTSLDCGLTAQVTVNQIDDDTIEFQYLNLSNAPSNLQEATSHGSGMLTERLYRCIA